MAEAVDVREPRQVPERQRLVGQQRARHQSQRRVLRARDRNPPLEPFAAIDDDPVHRARLTPYRPARKLSAGPKKGAEPQALDFDQGAFSISALMFGG